MNGKGLEDISGERIWMELKKILEGNFAGELLMKILDCELGKYIGEVIKKKTVILCVIYSHKQMHCVKNCQLLSHFELKF